MGISRLLFFCSRIASFLRCTPNAVPFPACVWKGTMKLKLWRYQKSATTMESHIESGRTRFPEHLSWSSFRFHSILILRIKWYRCVGSITAVYTPLALLFGSTLVISQIYMTIPTPKRAGSILQRSEAGDLLQQINRCKHERAYVREAEQTPKRKRKRKVDPVFLVGMVWNQGFPAIFFCQKTGELYWEGELLSVLRALWCCRGDSGGFGWLLLLEARLLQTWSWITC